MKLLKTYITCISTKIWKLVNELQRVRMVAVPCNIPPLVIFQDIFKESVNPSFHHGGKNASCSNVWTPVQHTHKYFPLPRDSSNTSFYLPLSPSCVCSFSQHRVGSIWHASVNKSKAALLGSTMHTERKKEEERIRRGWSGRGKGSFKNSFLYKKASSGFL